MCVEGKCLEIKGVAAVKRTHAWLGALAEAEANAASCSHWTWDRCAYIRLSRFVCAQRLDLARCAALRCCTAGPDMGAHSLSPSPSLSSTSAPFSAAEQDEASFNASLRACSASAVSLSPSLCSVSSFSPPRGLRCCNILWSRSRPPSLIRPPYLPQTSIVPHFHIDSLSPISTCSIVVNPPTWPPRPWPETGPAHCTTAVDMELIRLQATYLPANMIRRKTGVRHPDPPPSPFPFSSLSALPFHHHLLRGPNSQSPSAPTF